MFLIRLIREQLSTVIVNSLTIFAVFTPLLSKATQAVVMHNIFYAPEENGLSKLKPYVEIYWQVDPQSILFNKEQNIWQGKIKTDIIVRSDTSIVAQAHYILETSPVTEGAQTLNQKIIDLQRFHLPDGHFSIELKLSDLTSKRNDFIYKDTFSAHSVAPTPFFSDIQLVDTSVASSKQSPFQRNNHLQIPLCTNFLDDQRKSIHYYAELYNTHTLTPGQQPVTRKVFISRKEFGPAYNQIMHTDTALLSLLQITEGKLSTATLPSGNYYLNMIIEDKQLQRLAAQSLFFQIINSNPAPLEVKAETPAPADSAATASNSSAPASGKSEPVSVNILNLNKTFVAKYTASQIRAVLKMLIPIAEPTERNNIQEFLRKPDDMYSRYFIYNFWLNRNKLNPEAEWKAYSEKVKEVNKLFGSKILPGYESDRGVIYLKYGSPTERVIVLNEQGALPYEVWQYNALPKASNAMLLFYRPGFIANDFKLLHTTINGELRNRSWRNSLYPSGRANERSNSRAEQYLGNL